MHIPTAIEFQWGYRAPGVRTPVAKITWRDTPLQTEALFLEQVMTVSPTREYAELIEDVVDAINKLIEDTLEDWKTRPTPSAEEALALAGEDGEFGSGLS